MMWAEQRRWEAGEPVISRFDVVGRIVLSDEARQALGSPGDEPHNGLSQLLGVPLGGLPENHNLTHPQQAAILAVRAAFVELVVQDTVRDGRNPFFYPGLVHYGIYTPDGGGKWHSDNFRLSDFPAPRTRYLFRFGPAGPTLGATGEVNKRMVEKNGDLKGGPAEHNLRIVIPEEGEVGRFAGGFGMHRRGPGSGWGLLMTTSTTELPYR